jgi:hypothetical protein
MSKKVEGITSDEWLQATFGTPAIKPPAGSFTVEEAMQKTGFKRTTMERKLKERELSGEVVCIKCLVNGRFVKYFTPVKPKK